MTLNKTLAAAFAALTILASAGSAFAATGVATGSVNIREEPNTYNDPIGVLHKGEYVEIVACGGGWCEIDDDGDEGYVSASYLALVGDYEDEDDYDAEDFFDDVDVEFEYDHGGVDIEFEF